MLFLLPFFISGLHCLKNPTSKGHYHPSKWDPLLVETTAYDEIKNTKGWFTRHAKKIKTETFGDISMITMNLYTRSMSVPTEEEISAISEILDHVHPTIFCLQGVDEDVMRKLKSLLAESNHYRIVNSSNSYADLANGQEYFLPIIYDEYVLKKQGSGYFFTGGTEDKIMYASWARFKSYNVEFTIVNIDLFSSFKDMTNAEFANILADITTDKMTSSHPTLVMGGITTMPDSVKNLLSSEYKNLLDVDWNNEKMVRTTLHAQGLIDDNVQRDFIILRDRNHKFGVNYARILSLFPKNKGHHYPVHAILTVRPKIRKGKPMTRKTNATSVLKNASRQDERKMIQESAMQARQQIEARQGLFRTG